VKSLIIYQSIHHNNTEKSAQKMATELNADLVRTNQIKDLDVSGYDLIGFGSGIYFGK
jgi:flavodoxin